MYQGRVTRCPALQFALNQRMDLFRQKSLVQLLLNCDCSNQKKIPNEANQQLEVDASVGEQQDREEHKTRTITCDYWLPCHALKIQNPGISEWWFAFASSPEYKQFAGG